MSIAPPEPRESLPAADDTAATDARAPRRARGQLRVEALLAAAAEVFASKGFDAATMTEIAAQSESSIGSLYQFFRTKEAVADALVRAQVDALCLRLDGLAAQSAALSTPALAHALAVSLVEFRRDHPSFATLIERPGPPSPFVLGVRRDVGARVAAILAQHSPQADPALLRAMAPVVQHVMKSAVQMHGYLAPGEWEAAARELDAMLLSYLVARLQAA